MSTTAALVESTPHQDNDGGTVSLILTFLPLVLLVAMFVPVLRFVRQSHRRIDASLALQRELLAEVRAIRAAVVKDGQAGGDARIDS